MRLELLLRVDPTQPQSLWVEINTPDQPHGTQLTVHLWCSGGLYHTLHRASMLDHVWSFRVSEDAKEPQCG